MYCSTASVAQCAFRLHNNTKDTILIAGLSVYPVDPEKLFYYIITAVHVNSLVHTQ